MQQRYDRSDFHFAGFHLVPHEFRSPAYHQPADKYSDDEERKVIHPAYADTTEPCINLHVQHFYHPRKRQGRVVHPVDRPIGGYGGHNTPQSGGTNPKRISFPSIEPFSCAIPMASIRGLPPISCDTLTQTPIRKATSITP